MLHHHDDETLEELAQLEQELAVERARSNLLGFIKHIDVDDAFVVSWHHRLLCRLLDSMVDGSLRRLLVSMPPRHGKSQVLSRHFPAYILGRNPDARIIATSHTADLASAFNRDVQRIIDRPEYAQVFPHTRLKSAMVTQEAAGHYLRTSDMFEVVGYRGYYKSAGIGGAITGMGGDWLVCDDLLKDWQQAKSPTVRLAQQEWYRSTLRTRAAKDARILGCMTRWHEDDVFGWLIEMARSDPLADQWTVINLPAINEDGPGDYDPRGVGEALWPEFFPLEELAKHRAGGLQTFVSLYQGRPAPAEGNIVKNEWWRYYAVAPERFDRVIISADLTFKDTAKGDYCAWQVWGKKGAAAYLLAEVHARQDFVAQCACLARLVDAWPHYSECVIEDAANGAAMVATMRSRIPKVIAVPPVGSKIGRAEAVSPLIEAGNVYLPERAMAPWVEAFVLEWGVFPKGRFDDRVDAASQALARLFPPRSAYKNMFPASFTRPNPLASLG